MFKNAIVPLLFATTLLLCLPAEGQEQPQAQPKCGPRGEVLAYLAEKYQEVPRFAAYVGPQRLLIVTVSPTGKSWTLIGLTPQGQACLILDGTDWTPIDALPAEASHRDM